MRKSTKLKIKKGVALPPLRPKFVKVDDLFIEKGVPNANGGRRYPLTEIWKKWYAAMRLRSLKPLFIEGEKISERGWEIFDPRDQESVLVPDDVFQKELEKQKGDDRT